MGVGDCWPTWSTPLSMGSSESVQHARHHCRLHSKGGPQLLKMADDPLASLRILLPINALVATIKQNQRQFWIKENMMQKEGMEGE